MNDSTTLCIYKDDENVWHTEETNFDVFEFDMSMSSKNKKAVWEQFFKWLNLMAGDTLNQ